MDAIQTKLEKLRQQLNEAKAADAIEADRLDSAAKRKMSGLSDLFRAIDYQARWQAINECQPMSKETLAILTLGKSVKGLAEDIRTLMVGGMRAGAFS